MNRMLWAALAVATLAGVSAPAHATLICDNPTQTVGAKGKNPVISSVVWHDGPVWNVVHTLRDGTRIDRSTQYTMTDMSNGSTLFGWHGVLNRNTSLWMSGNVTVIDANHATYVEQLHDGNQGNAIIARSYAYCHTPNDNPPPMVAQAPTYMPPAAPPPSNQVVVPFNSASRTDAQQVNVTVGGTPVSMTIDSGCNTMALSPAFADQLISQGEASVVGTIDLSLAAGQHQTGRRLVVHRVQVGDRVLTDVVANDGGATDDMLLGQSVLGYFGRFSIDLTRHQLVLG